MPRQKHAVSGGRDGGQRAAWATGDYNQDDGCPAAGSDGEEAGPSGRDAQNMAVRLAMWDLGQCDRKR